MDSRHEVVKISNFKGSSIGMILVLFILLVIVIVLFPKLKPVSAHWMTVRPLSQPRKDL
ncbi:hypothetical protein [Paenibacillus herberti]|uniref:hypothetical protein n=1 Tax=Paenibacillus herberti TaxID=1619309 RepID=UPI0015958E10|nr:hypothetical protein [Paenibacillus herberti]